MVWHGHIFSSDIGLVLSHRPGNPGVNVLSLPLAAPDKTARSCLHIPELETARAGGELALLAARDITPPDGLDIGQEHTLFFYFLKI